MNLWFKHWRQRWRMPELRLLLVALLVSVTVVSAVGFFTSRVDSAMQTQAKQLLGGDLVLTSARPLAESYLKRATELGLASTQTISFPSMASAGENSQLSQLKIVAAGYPLRGEMRTAPAIGVADENVTGTIPAQGEIWAEARLFNELNVKPNASVQLGNSTFKLTRVLTQEPDRGTNLFQLAPVIIMNQADLAATGLLSPASRARFTQLFAGKGKAIASLRAELEPNLKPTERFRTLNEDLASVQQALQRSGRFLSLAALLSVVLAGAAVVLTSASLMRRELPAVAVLKAMGMTRRQVIEDYTFSLCLTALLGAFFGVLLGFGLQYLLAYWLGQVVEINLPAPSLIPIISGFLTALILLVGFALPQLMRLVNTSPMQILHGSIAKSQQSIWLLSASLLIAVFGLLWLQAHDLKVASLLLMGLLVGIGLFWLAAQGSLRLLQRLGKHIGRGWIPAVGRSPRVVLLVVVFATGLFSLLVLTTVRTDLLNRWQETLPKDAPDHFLINIQPAEVEPLKQFFQSNQIKAELYPMIRGRLVSINDKAVLPNDYADPTAQRLLEREFNLSSFNTLPASNVLVAGKWFTQETSGLSIEKGIGETLKFGLGDKLTFDIAGQQLTQIVTSVREVKWDSMQPNFFVIAAPTSIDAFPRTFITSIHLGTHKDLITPLIHQFPSVTAIDIGAILVQVRTLIEQASLAVQGIFVFTLIAGIVVLIAALQSQKAERRREIAILKSLGAGQAELKRRIWGEFLLLGALAGVLAGLLAVVAGNLFGYFLFDLPIHWSLLPLMIGGLTGSLLVGVTGYWNLRALLAVLPLTLLKT